MHIKEVKYTKQFNYHGIDEWIGVTVDVQPGEDSKTALHSAKALVEEFYSEISPQHNGSVVIQKEKEVPSELKGTLAELDKCLSLDELKGFWLVCKSNLMLSSAYKTRENQLKQLQNAGN